MESLWVGLIGQRVFRGLRIGRVSQDSGPGFGIQVLSEFKCWLRFSLSLSFIESVCPSACLPAYTAREMDTSFA